MKNQLQFLFALGVIATLYGCDTADNETTYSCAIGGCVEDANGSYYSMSDCENGCNAGAGVTDADGNTYTSIIIGNQEWLQSNLNVATYRNGDPIPEVQDLETWRDLETGAWCHYANATANGVIYGKLYNWYAVVDPRGLAPEGWHVATDDEWVILTDQFGGNQESGGALKATGTQYWLEPNAGATNASGFTALPGGTRGTVNDFSKLNEDGWWWTSSESSPAFGSSRLITHDFDGALDNYSSRKEVGHAVRCVRD
jgi:uncharacterized protein (TIGR02145 family)